MSHENDSGFDSCVSDICSDEIARVLRNCRQSLPEVDGHRILAHLQWLLSKYFGYHGPPEAAESAERAALHALFQLDGFRPDEIDEALRPAMQTVEDVLANKPRQKTGPMRRTRWNRGKVVAFPPSKDRIE